MIHSIIIVPKVPQIAAKVPYLAFFVPTLVCVFAVCLARPFVCAFINHASGLSLSTCSFCAKTDNRPFHTVLCGLASVCSAYPGAPMPEAPQTPPSSRAIDSKFRISKISEKIFFEKFSLPTPLAFCVFPFCLSIHVIPMFVSDFRKIGLPTPLVIMSH